jgi:hypothetical protein
MRIWTYRDQVTIMNAMTKSRRQELSEIFAEQWQRSRDWLVPFMQNNQPKFLTKDELRSVAMRELEVSKLSFDLGWIMAIEDSGHQLLFSPVDSNRYNNYTSAGRP